MDIFQNDTSQFWLEILCYAFLCSVRRTWSDHQNMRREWLMLGQQTWGLDDVTTPRGVVYQRLTWLISQIGCKK
jgi:hypothetical protein